MNDPQQKKEAPKQVVTVSSGSYCLAFFGALIYFLEHANSFGEGLMGVVKAILWPAFLLYRLLEFLNM